MSAANAAASAQDWPLILDSINPNAADERAYREDFEVLVRDHCGEFAAYHDGRLLCTDREEEIAYRRARLQVPEGVIYLIPIRPR